MESKISLEENVQLNFFDVKDLLVFKNFLSLPNESEFECLKYNFLNKLSITNQIKEKKEIIFELDENFIIDTYLNFLISLVNSKIYKIKTKIQRMNKTTKIIKENQIENILSTYSSITDLEINKAILSKKPFSHFNNESENPTSIFSNKEKCETIFHMIFHYVYYIVVKYFWKSESAKSFITNTNLHPKLLTKKIENFLIDLKDQNSSDIKYNNFNPIYLLNKIFRLFNFLDKKTKIFFYDNQSIIELLFHFLIQSSYLDNKFDIISKGKIFQNLNKRIVIQTGIMLINRNNSNQAYKKNIALILSDMISQNYTNFLILINVFDNSNLNFDACRILIKKLLTSIPNYMENNFYYKKIISNVFQIILTCNKNKKDDNLQGLQEFLIELIIEIINSYKEDENFVLVLIQFIYANFFRKFGFVVELNLNKEEKFDIKHSKNLQFKETILSENYINFLKFLIENFEYVIKSTFIKILEKNEKNILNILLKIIIKLWSKNKMYYVNIKEDKLPTIQNFVLIHFDYLNPILISNYFLKYFTQDLFKIFKNSHLFDFSIEYTTDDNNCSKSFLKIRNIKRNLKSILEYFSSNDFLTETLNSLENIFSLKPFSNLEFLKEILSCYLSEKISLKEEFILDYEDFQLKCENMIYTKEDIEEMLILLDKVNILFNSIKQKIFLQTIISLTNYENIISISQSEEIFKVFLFILNSESWKGNKELIEGVINCFGVFLSNTNKGAKICISIKKQIFEVISHIKRLDIDMYPLIEQINQEISEFISKVNDTSDLSDNYEDKENNMIEEFKSKISNYLEKVDKVDTNYKKSCIIHEVNLTFLKMKSSLRKDSSFLDTKFLQNVCTVLLKTYKLTDIFVWKNIQTCLISLFDLILETKKKNYLNFFFMMIKSFFDEYAKISINSAKEDNDSNIYLSDQFLIKLIELIEKIIKQNKRGSIIFSKEIVEFMFDIFDNYFYKINSTVIAGCISTLAILLNYAPLEINYSISTLVRTSLNLLKNTNKEVEIKRSAAFLLFKIIQNSEFEYFKDYAKEIYNCVKFNTDNLQIDKVVKFHLIKCLDIIQLSVSNFYMYGSEN